MLKLASTINSWVKCPEGKCLCREVTGNVTVLTFTGTQMYKFWRKSVAWGFCISLVSNQLKKLTYSHTLDILFFPKNIIKWQNEHHAVHGLTLPVLDSSSSCRTSRSPQWVLVLSWGLIKLYYVKGPNHINRFLSIQRSRSSTPSVSCSVQLLALSHSTNPAEEPHVSCPWSDQWTESFIQTWLLGQLVGWKNE